MKRLSLNIAICVFSILFLVTGTSYAQGAVRVIDIHAKRFSFSPAEITLKKGETVKLVVTSSDVTHSLVIPGLHVKQTIKKGHPAEITITPTQVGDFRGRCGHFCGSGHGSMVFTVHVKDN